jgi:hypothetical protein
MEAIDYSSIPTKRTRDKKPKEEKVKIPKFVREYSKDPKPIVNKETF